MFSKCSHPPPCGPLSAALAHGIGAQSPAIGPCDFELTNGRGRSAALRTIFTLLAKWLVNVAEVSLIPQPIPRPPGAHR